MDESTSLTSKLGKLIRGRRSSLNLTLDETAKLSGISRNSVWAMEHDKYEIKAELYLKVLQALGLRLNAYSEDEEFLQRVL